MCFQAELSCRKVEWCSVPTVDLRALLKEHAALRERVAALQDEVERLRSLEIALFEASAALAAAQERAERAELESRNLRMALARNMQPTATEVAYMETELEIATKGREHFHAELIATRAERDRLAAERDAAREALAPAVLDVVEERHNAYLLSTELEQANSGRAHFHAEVTALRASLADTRFEAANTIARLHAELAEAEAAIRALADAEESDIGDGTIEGYEAYLERILVALKHPAVQRARQQGREGT